MHPFRAICAALLAACATQAAAVGSLADVVVFDRSEGRQLPVYWHEGRAWVAGKPGNEYAVRIRNRGREEVLAVVSVDGVNAVSGEMASPQQSGYVIAPWRPFELTGWRKNLGSTAAFYFTTLPDSYAARWRIWDMKTVSRAAMGLALALGVKLDYTASAQVRNDVAARLAGVDAVQALPSLAFQRPMSASTWLEASNPSERWKWEFLYQDLPPVKGSVDASSLPAAPGVIRLNEVK